MADGYNEPRARQRRAFVAGLNWALNAGLKNAADPAQVNGAAANIGYTSQDDVAEFTWGAAQIVRILNEWDYRHAPPADLGPAAPEDK